MSAGTFQSINGTGTAAPAGDASDSGRVADRDTNAGATPARTLPSHTDIASTIQAAALEGLQNQRNELRKAMRFIFELSGECLDNGDVRVGTAAEVAMRHIWRRADEALSNPTFMSDEEVAK